MALVDLHREDSMSGRPDESTGRKVWWQSRVIKKQEILQLG